MHERYVSVWFPFFKTDWHSRRHPEWRSVPFVLFITKQGRKLISAANPQAKENGLYPGMVLADAKALVPSVIAIEEETTFFEERLLKFAEWFIRFSPHISVDPPDGLFITATGCAHLWGNEENYLSTISTRLKNEGYAVKLAMAGTLGAAWALCRFSETAVIPNGSEADALRALPARSLRLTDEANERLQKLGLIYINDFLSMPAPVLRRRLGKEFIQRLHQALGWEPEFVIPVETSVIYEERLPCLEPILTRIGIEIALQRLLDTICPKLSGEEKGLRLARLRIFRTDNTSQAVEIGTLKPTRDSAAVFKLFELKLDTLQPEPGIEVFVLELLSVEPLSLEQEQLWKNTLSWENESIALLVDRIINKIGPHAVSRYLPAAHHWPERSIQKATHFLEKPALPWNPNLMRPIRILPVPEPIRVTAPVPDYPPMLFRYKGVIHKVCKADGPERIEQEWWIQDGLHRDYYQVEDEQGCRYWIFRAGHYGDQQSVQWYLHGFFV